MDQYQFTANGMAGQRFMFGFDGTVLNNELKFLIRELKTSGIILFKQNIKTPGQVKKLCKSAQDYAAECGIPPLFIAVDQEGGTVARLRDGFTVFPGNPSITDLQEAEQFARITANELKNVGINMNFAPVLDAVPKDVDSIMKDRSFKGSPETVARLGACVIKHLQKHGVMAVAKHFPGIGRTEKDSHYHLPVLDIDHETLDVSDLVAFKAAALENVSGMMLSHILYPGLDREFQASLSPEIVQSILRKDLGYDGMVMTDDLDMKAIKKDIQTCVHQICKAGIDIALICHKGPNIEQAHKEMVRLLKENGSYMESGQKSIERILRYKQQYPG